MLLGEEHGSELAELDDDVAGAFFEEKLSGLDEVGGAGEGTGFSFVKDEEVELGQNLVETGCCNFDPEVHGVGDDESGF